MSIQESTPGGVYDSVEQPHLERPSRKCCTVKYRLRYFYSKGAFLVLLWVSLIGMTFFPFCDFFSNGLLELVNMDSKTSYLFVVVLPLTITCILLTGWLADAKLGNYKVFKTGAVLTFFAASAESIALILQDYAFNHDGKIAGVLLVSGFLGLMGISISIPTALQLGLDQMPDASAVNVSSFIAWLIASISCGVLVSWLLPSVVQSCVSKDSILNTPVDKLFGLQSVLFMTIVCCSIFLLGPKYLLLEPESPQSLKIIYQVLKFAAKHKAPLNRSALTYWEEDIPSRLDLGKSKYGGPFTTEQVEDVKTFFKVLLFLIPLTIICSGSAMSIDIGFISLPCSVELIRKAFFPSSWWISICFYEFAIYPLARNKLPTILKCIGIMAVLILIIKCLYLVNMASDILCVNTNSSSDVLHSLTNWTNSLLGFLNGSLMLMLFIKTLEFVCAQSPHYMRGLLTTCCILGVVCFPVVWNFLFRTILSEKILSEPFYVQMLVLKTIALVLCLVGFILYCVLARWYKLRVRDEEYNVHRVVEEVYDQYLSHRSYR